MYLEPNNATKITLACCVLHNILRTHSQNSYSPSGFADEVEEDGNIIRGEWRGRNGSAMQLLAATTSRHPSHNAEKIRDVFRKKFYLRSSVSRDWDLFWKKYSKLLGKVLQKHLSHSVYFRTLAGYKHAGSLKALSTQFFLRVFLDLTRNF